MVRKRVKLGWWLARLDHKILDQGQMISEPAKANEGIPGIGVILFSGVKY